MTVNAADIVIAMSARINMLEKVVADMKEQDQEGLAKSMETYRRGLMEGRDIVLDAFRAVTR